MARVVSCGQCGAPHRPPHGVTRYRCDFCGTANERDDGPDYEELVSSREFSRARAAEVLAREALARGFDPDQVTLEAPRWLALWQAVSRDGEEQLLCADPAAAGPLDARLGLPALPLTPRDADASPEMEMPESPPIDAADAAEASRALFGDSEFEPRSLRLIWLRVADLWLHTPSERQRGLYVAGAERIFVPRVADTGPRSRLRSDLLSFYAVFLAGAVGTGLLVADPVARALGILGWAAATYLVARAARPRSGASA